MMCAIDLLLNRTNKDSDDKAILNELIQKEKALCEATEQAQELERMLNITKAKLAIQLI